MNCLKYPSSYKDIYLFVCMYTPTFFRINWKGTIILWYGGFHFVTHAHTHTHIHTHRNKWKGLGSLEQRLPNSCIQLTPFK